MEWRKYASGNLFLQSFIVTFLLFGISYGAVGWWTDAYQHMFDTAISGELTNYYLPAAHNPFPEYMYGAAYFFNRLGMLLPIRWIALFLNGILFLSIWILFYQILKYSKDYPILSRLILLAFFCLLFFESVVLYHMVRVTMFAGIAAMSFLIVTEENKFLSKRAIPYLLLFIVALWIRCNVHLFVLVFVTAVFIVHKKPLKPLAPFWISFVLFFLMYCKIVFWTDHTHDLNSFFLYNTEFKLYHQGNYKPDLKLIQPLDSLKYAAITHDILGDEKNLGVDFYERIGIFTNLSKFSYGQLIYAYQTFISALTQNIYFIIADLVLIFYYILLGGNKLQHYKLKTIGLFVFFYMVVFAICFIKMENRFLVPFQVLFLFTIMTLHQPKLFSEKKNIYYLLVFAVIIFPLSSIYIAKKIEYSKSTTKTFKDAFEWIGKNYAGQTVVYNTGFVTQNRPFETFYQKNYFHRFYLYNYYAIQLSEWYRPYLQEDCKCNVGNLYPFYDYLTAGKEKVLLIDQPAKDSILKEYLSKVWNKNYEFNDSIPYTINKDTSSFTLESFRGKLNLYELSVPKKE